MGGLFRFKPRIIKIIIHFVHGLGVEHGEVNLNVKRIKMSDDNIQKTSLMDNRNVIGVIAEIRKTTTKIRQNKVTSFEFSRYLDIF